MKRIIFAAFSLILIVSSCKKSQDYGFNVDNSPKGVAFNQAVNLAAGTKASDSISIIGGVTPSSSSQTTLDVYITLEAEQVSNTDVTIGITFKPNIVPQGYEVLTTSQVQVPTTVKILAGKQFVIIPIIFPNASSFDLVKTYALGLELNSADQGFQIAANRKQIVVAYKIKNQYEGDYLCVGKRTRYTGPTFGSGILDFFTVNAVLPFVTRTATTIRGQLADAGAGVLVDLDVSATGVLTVTTPSGVTGFMQDPTKPLSTYDPVTKVFQIYVIYFAGSGNLRQVEEKLTKQ